MIAWPPSLKPFNGGFAPSVRSLSGGQSLSGFEQVQPQLHDRWAASFAFYMRNPASVTTMRAFLSQLRGRANSVALPAFDTSSKPWEIDPVTGLPNNLARARKRKLDNTVFADAPGLVDALIIAELASNVALNATAAQIHVTKGGAPVAGQRFSLANRLYSIDDVTVIGGGVYGVTFWPWAREVVAVNAPVNFTSPRCEMRLADDAEGQDAMKAMALGRSGQVSLNFDEVAVA